MPRILAYAEWVEGRCRIGISPFLTYTTATANKIQTKDGGKNVKMKDGKEKNVMPVSTAEYNPCGWRAWLNNVTITVGVDNVTDEQPPFVASAFENGYDQQTANNKGRLWYVGIKKRF
jgi:outer membrane receptor for ferrienterochelin and colicin